MVIWAIWLHWNEVMSRGRSAFIDNVIHKVEGLIVLKLGQTLLRWVISLFVLQKQSRMKKPNEVQQNGNNC